jgi:hypothetical protein
MERKMDANIFGNLMVVFGMCFGILMMTLYLVSLVWVYRDSEKRGKTGCIWLLLVFFTWPFGLIAYYLLRDQEVVL